MKRVQKEPNGCWVFTGPRNKKGYGIITRDDKQCLVHRYVYTHLIGPIPEGHVLRQACNNKLCCNPDHLVPMDQIAYLKEFGNWSQAGRYQKAKTHCPHGHPYDVENTRIRKDGGRACRTCERANLDRWLEKHPEYNQNRPWRSWGPKST